MVYKALKKPVFSICFSSAPLTMFTMRLISLITLIPCFVARSAFAGVPRTVIARQNGGNTTSIIDDDVDAFVNLVLAEWNSPGGVAIAFVRKNENGTWTNVETKGYGRATARGTNVTENTMFNVASNSKLFTVFAASLLINNETLSPRLNWDTPISQAIPQFNLTDPIAASKSTLLDLMSHRTGYPLHDFNYRYSDDIPAAIHKLQSVRQSGEFRDIWQYNNNMYTTLSYLSPSLLPSRQPLARYVKEFILDKLGMNRTTYDYNLANSDGQRADGMGRQGIDVYVNPFAGTPRAVEWWAPKTGGEDGNLLSGAGGIITCATDLTTWLKFLLLGGVNPVTNESIISPGVLEKTTAALIPQTLTPDFPELSIYAYGAGQSQITYRGHLIVEHGGFIRGFNSQVSRLPNDGIGLAVLTNDNEYGKVISEIVKKFVIDKALGLEPIDWNSRFKGQKSIPLARATPRPSNATLPSVNFTDLAGTYNDDGYGEIELCLLSPENTAATDSCKLLSSNLTTILPGAVRPGIPTLLGHVDSPWFSHIIIEHFDADVFNISLVFSTATNDSSLPFWTYNDQRMSDNGMNAELDAQNSSSIALGFSGYWGGFPDGTAPALPKPAGNTVRERAEVYFVKQ